MDYEVRYLTKHWDHHSLHSGYDQLVPRLGSSIAPINIHSLREKWIPGRIAVWLAARSGNRLYSQHHFYYEWAATREMLLPHKLKIFHVLYGDDSFRYFGSFGKDHNSRIVASYHLPPSDLRKFYTSTDYIRKLDGLITVGRNQIPFFESITNSDRIFFVPHGVDTQIFFPPVNRNWDDGIGQICLFVGVHRRDFGTLRRTIEIVNTFDKPIHFILVTKKDYFDLFRELKHVDLLCNIPESELVRLYQAADLLIQPLEDSTANNAILEGLACGLPVITTDIGAVRDYVDESCAILVSPHDAEEMAQATIDLLDDGAAMLRMGISARKRAIQFDWSAVVIKLKQVYSQVANF